MQRVLITGGAGFIGSNLANELVRKGIHVSIIDNFSTGKKENINPSVYCWEQDLTEINFSDLCKYIKDVDVVFHLAAKARIQPSFNRPSKYIETNFGGTYTIVRACKHKNIPLVYAGSSSHHSGKFKNPYTFSKDLGEDIIKLYQLHFGLKATIARFYNVYGPNQLTEGGYTTLIGKWLNNIENGIPCEIYGDGKKRRDFTHVKDIINGLIKIVDLEAYDKVFEFGRGKNYSVNEVAKMLSVKPIYKEDRPGEAQDTLADYSLAKDVLSWEPKLNLEDYIQGETYEEN